MIKNPNDIVEKLVADYLKIFGDDLVSVIMYGSAVSHEFRPGKSDINTLLVLKDNSIKRIHECTGFQKKWYSQGVAIPLFMTREFIRSSLDTYPIEFLDIQSNYRVLYGEDVLSGIKLEKEHLRLQCERELKGIALHLRTEYLRVAGRSKDVESLLSASVRKLIPIFKAVLVLNDRKIPGAKSEAISCVEDLYSLGASALSDVFFKSQQFRDNYVELFDRFAGVIDVITLHVDEMKGNDSSPAQ